MVKPPEPRRRTQACNQCHIKKTRCLGELPSCSNCVRKGRTCTYPKSTRKPGGSSSSATAAGVASGSGGGAADEGSASRSGSESHAAAAVAAAAIDVLGSAGPSSSLGPEPETALELVEDYFRHLYPLPSFAFLHQPTVVQRCRDGTMNGPLQLAMCALTAQRRGDSNPSSPSALPHDRWAQRAEQAVLQQLGHPSIFHLQALLLVVHYRVESGAFPAAFMLAALAARTAVALRLNYERSELLPVAQ